MGEHLDHLGQAPACTHTEAGALLDEAGRLISAGLHLLPLWSIDDAGRCGCGQSACGSPGKHPIGVLVPRGLQDASADLARVERWLEHHSTANLGVRTGGESGVIVLDVDGPEGMDALTRLETDAEPLPITWTATTGRGVHYYVRHPGRLVRNSVRHLGPGLDLRGDGGYVVVPPSRHASGRDYAWEAGRAPWACALANAPTWLFASATPAARGRNSPSAARPSAGSEPAIGEGLRNVTLASLAGSMRYRGFSEAAILAALREENQVRCQPPLEEDEVIRIARSIGRYPPGQPTDAVSRFAPRPTTGFAPFEIRGGKAVAR